MKILVFGGTFNPVHNGHVAMCKVAQEKISPDLTLIIPTYMPPHKAVNGILLDGQDRMNMCRLAFEQFENTQVSDIELAAHEKSYTIITLQKLHEKYPTADIYMLCGADMFLTLKTWYKYDQIIKLATICAVPRDGGVDELFEYAKSDGLYGGNYIIINTPTIDISSTEIRECIISGKGTENMLPKKVADYIKENKLFR